MNGRRSTARIGVLFASIVGATTRDVVFGLRFFRRQPGIVLVTVGGLAVAIGFSAFAFSIVSAEVLRPLGVRDPGTLFRLETGRGRIMSQWSYADYAQLRDYARLIRLGASVSAQATLGEYVNTPPGERSTLLHEGGGQTASVAFVSDGYLEMMGASVVAGRSLGPADHTATTEPAVVVQHVFWEQQFGADESVIGSVVELSGEPFTIVGVADPSFGGPMPYPPAFWAPLEAYGRTLAPRRISSAAHADLLVSVYGRIGAGTDPRQAVAELVALAESIAADGTDAVAPLHPVLNPVDLRSFGTGADEVVLMLTFALGAIGLVLLLAGANVASLLLASGLSRQEEVGVRMALGASRGRVARQLVTESVTLGLFGGGLGLLLATWAMAIMRAMLPISTVDRTPDARVYGFVAMVSILGGVIAGLAPARYGAHGDLLTPLRGGGTRARGSLRPRRTRSVLVGTQAAISTVVLVVAGLLTAAATHLARFDYGIDIDRLVTVSAPHLSEDYDDAAATAYWESAAESVLRLSAVERASLVRVSPFSGYVNATVPYGGRRHEVDFNYASADWFGTAGLQFVRGRAYTGDEVATGAPVIVISESVARDLWAGEDALGSPLDRVRQNLTELPPGWVTHLVESLAGARVIGIVADTTTDVRDGRFNRHMIYLPITPAMLPSARLVIRTTSRPDALTAPLREAVLSIDPDVRLTVTTVREELERDSGDVRILATFAGTIGGVALALAITGVFGLAAFIVERRAPEIGLRIAVGASVGDVLRLMVRDSLRPVAVGVAVGVAAAPALARMMQGVLYGVSGYDPVPVLGSAAVLVAAAMLAAIVPARRVARVDPIVALQRR